jgi:dihydrodipicolinate synthase/N-acetylneuraminate lyase
MNKWEGILPILATPFTEQGKLDTASLEKLVEYLSQNGVHGITMFGIASEFYKLTDQERDIMTELVIRTANKRVPVIVSMTDQSAEIAVERAKKTEALGADGLMIFPPFFMQPGKAVIEDHILQIARAVDIPIMVQYAPNQSGVTLEPDFFVNLHQQSPNIRYVKVESVPPGTMISTIRHKEQQIRTFVGYAGIQMIDAFRRGAAGVQPGCSFTEVYVEIYRLYKNGEIEQAERLHQRLLPLLNLLMQNVALLIQAEKEILYRRGIIATPYCRSPRYAMDEYQLEQMTKYLRLIEEWL